MDRYRNRRISIIIGLAMAVVALDALTPPRGRSVPRAAAAPSQCGPKGCPVPRLEANVKTDLEGTPPLVPLSRPLVSPSSPARPLARAIFAVG